MRQLRQGAEHSLWVFLFSQEEGDMFREQERSGHSAMGVGTLGFLAYLTGFNPLRPWEGRLISQSLV